MKFVVPMRERIGDPNNESSLRGASLTRYSNGIGILLALSKFQYFASEFVGNAQNENSRNDISRSVHFR